MQHRSRSNSRTARSSDGKRLSARIDTKNSWLTSDGFFSKDYGNRNRKQLVSAVVSFAKQGTETETTYGPGRPARPPEAKIPGEKNL